MGCRIRGEPGPAPSGYRWVRLKKWCGATVWDAHTSTCDTFMQTAGA
jgi:hypothetical protein